MCLYTTNNNNYHNYNHNIKIHKYENASPQKTNVISSKNPILYSFSFGDRPNSADFPLNPTIQYILTIRKLKY